MRCIPFTGHKKGPCGTRNTDLFHSLTVLFFSATPLLQSPIFKVTTRSGNKTGPSPPSPPELELKYNVDLIISGFQWIISKIQRLQECFLIPEPQGDTSLAQHCRFVVLEYQYIGRRVNSKGISLFPVHQPNKKWLRPRSLISGFYILPNNFTLSHRCIKKSSYIDIFTRLPKEKQVYLQPNAALFQNLIP